MKKLGIIGGVGPMASAVFIEKIIQYTDAATDQEHIPMAIEICPYIPDRTAYILDNTKPNPIIPIIDAAKRLKGSGASKVAIPCVTSMAFCDEISQGIGLPVYNMIDLAARTLLDENISQIGIMATDGTLKSGLFEKILGTYDIELIRPLPDFQRMTMSLIYDFVKAGIVPDKSMFLDIKNHFFERNINKIILGCTEFSVLSHHNLSEEERTGTLDILDVLSKKCVEDFGRLKS